MAAVHAWTGALRGRKMWLWPGTGTHRLHVGYRFLNSYIVLKNGFDVFGSCWCADVADYLQSDCFLHMLMYVNDC